MSKVEERLGKVEKNIEHLTKEVITIRTTVSKLSTRLGYGFEEIARKMIEEFSGRKVIKIQGLTISDDKGVVFGVPAEIEFDIYGLFEDGKCFVAECKMYCEWEDVLKFSRKAKYLEETLGIKCDKYFIVIVASKKCLDVAKKVNVNVLYSEVD